MLTHTHTTHTHTQIVNGSCVSLAAGVASGVDTSDTLVTYMAFSSTLSLTHIQTLANTHTRTDRHTHRHTHT